MTRISLIRTLSGTLAVLAFSANVPSAKAGEFLKFQFRNVTVGKVGQLPRAGGIPTRFPSHQKL